MRRAWLPAGFGSGIIAQDFDVAQLGDSSFGPAVLGYAV